MLDKTWRTQRALDAVVRERRIRLGMARLTHEHQAILRVAYEGRVLSKELREALGDFCDLALRMPSVDVAYDHYLANWKPTKRIPNPYGRETWLVIAAKHGSDLLPRLRNEVEAAVAAALTAFAAVVDPVAQEEAPPRVRATRAPRRDGGPPFMFDEPGKERS